MSVSKVTLIIGAGILGGGGRNCNIQVYSRWLSGF